MVFQTYIPLLYIAWDHYFRALKDKTRTPNHPSFPFTPHPKNSDTPSVYEDDRVKQPAIHSRTPIDESHPLLCKLSLCFIGGMIKLLPEG
jgi:hypothetical protein